MKFENFKMCEVSLEPLRLTCKSLCGIVDSGVTGLTHVGDQESGDILHELPGGLFEKLPLLRRLDFSYPLIGDLGPLSVITALEELSLRECTSLAPIAALTTLKSLTLVASETTLADLLHLTTLTRLRSLDLHRTKWGVTDVAPFGLLTSLHTLNISSTELTDVASLALLTSLHTLNISNTEVAVMPHMASLRSLDCSRSKVTLPMVARHADLTALYFNDDNNIMDPADNFIDFNDLKTLTSLKILQCNKLFTPISNIQPLSQLISLESLSMNKNYWNTDQDLCHLTGLSALTYLSINHIRIVSTSPLRSMTSLRSLDCSYIYILRDSDPDWNSLGRDAHVFENLSPLSALSSLTYLDVRCNANRGLRSEKFVQDLTPLAGLTALKVLKCERIDDDSS